jgi:hypothetical protein
LDDERVIKELTRKVELYQTWAEALEYVLIELDWCSEHGIYSTPDLFREYGIRANIESHPYNLGLTLVTMLGPRSEVARYLVDEYYGDESEARECYPEVFE